MQPVLEDVLGIAILVLAAAFVLNRILAAAYFVGCVVHTARHRDRVAKVSPPSVDRFLRRLNFWMVRTWLALLATVLCYGVVRALR